MSGRRNSTIEWMEEQSVKNSESKLTPILIDLIRIKLMDRADKAMRMDNFEKAANDYFVASHIIPTSSDEFININGYKIGKTALNAIQEDLYDYFDFDYRTMNNYDNDLLRKYLKYLSDVK